ncbi:GNAT family N-acetyltransferase [Nocardia terpenica]|uniref:GNAT family N-acetyltransferase n=1 Tax=Nocardia terpenica TaxID=455432 RepID=A0A6G9Z673_9NOCA|nr:GNAT family N-acetyltransferase [Nocardia terpenica]QIS20992.1 GNAT family N-acetyltransferase [Nocardia terpenica]
MTDIRELHRGETELAAPAMLALRPRWETAGAIVDLIDSRLRPAGYRLAGLFDGEHESAVCVLGFREITTSGWGHVVYVDDLSTLPDARGHGHADRLLSWVEAEARRLGCEALHLDSGVGPDRFAAHRLYMRHHLAIGAHHFHLDL